MTNWEEIAYRNAEEYDVNVGKFMGICGCHPNQIFWLVDLIRMQEKKFFVAYANFITSGSATTLG